DGGPRSIPRKLNTVSKAQVKKSTEKAMLTESMRLRLKDPDLSIGSEVIEQTRKPSQKTESSTRAISEGSAAQAKAKALGFGPVTKLRESAAGAKASPISPASPVQPAESPMSGLLKPKARMPKG